MARVRHDMHNGIASWCMIGMAVPGHTSTFFGCTVDMICDYFSWEECRLYVRLAGVATIHHFLQILYHSEDSIHDSADGEDYGMLNGDPGGLGD